MEKSATGTLYMKSPNARDVPKVVIHADESASWMVAGLSQLERLLRALRETLGESTQVTVVWAEQVSPHERVLPALAGLAGIAVRFAETAPAADLEFSTHTVLYRRMGKPSITATELHAQLQASRTGDTWDYLENRTQIGACEKRLLRGSGKSQDGLVSRYLNRPISRALSRLLLRFPVTPSGWTLAIILLPLLGAVLLAQGDYPSVVLGLLLYQLYSIFDGCDGEIARAKYLESPGGRQLDTWCDLGGNLLLALSLGYGLASSYFAEGVIVALLLATNEFILALPAIGEPLPVQGDSPVYPRHQQMVQRSGLLILGPRVAWWLLQLTKRDVALLFFLFLALAGQPAWILHLLGAVALISSGLALRARRRR